MKNFKIQILFALASLFSALTALGAVTTPVPVACGYSDFVFDQIPSLTGEKSKLNLALSAKQGETGRRFLLYSDNSWILTYEFFSADSVEKDVSCMMETGTGETASDSLDHRYPAVPAQRIGPALSTDDEARLVLKPAQN